LNFIDSVLSNAATDVENAVYVAYPETFFLAKRAPRF